MAYNKTNWRDTIKDVNGNIIEKGTPLASTNLNKMEDGIANATEKAEKAEGDLVKVNQQLADTSSHLAEKVGREETGVLNLNVFDEPTRAAIQGLEPGQINAVLGKGNVKPENTDFLKRKSPNLLDKSKSTPNSAIGMANGGLVSLNNYSASDFIAVEGGKTYTQKTQNSNKAAYDSNKSFITAVATTSFTVPDNAAYIRVTYLTANTDEMVVEGTTLPSVFMEFNTAYTFAESIDLKESVGPEQLKDSAVTPDKTSFLVVDKSKKNLLNPETVTLDKAVGTYSGALSDYPGYATSDYIPVEPGKTYITSEAGNKAVYDQNKAVIGSAGVSTQSVVIPANGRFIRVSFPSSKLGVSEMVIEGTVFPMEYRSFGAPLEYVLDDTVSFGNDTSNNPWYNKKANVLGDSITNQQEPSASVKYPIIMRERLNLATVRNYGVSSSTITTGNGSYQPMVERYSAMDNDADLVTVFGGTNDWKNSQAMKGDFYTSGTTVNKDTTTFYGACHTLFEGLVKKYAGRDTDIVVITPIPRTGDKTPNTYSGMTLKEYVDVIKEVAAYYSLPVLDLYNISGLQVNIPEISSNFFADGVHPNNKGQEKIANRLIGFLKGIR